MLDQAEELDDLLRREVFVDLYQVVRQSDGKTQDKSVNLSGAAATASTSTSA